MKLIVGLGNPGQKYANNRHNVGFMLIDYIGTLLNCSIVKASSNITIQQCNNSTISLIKPQTFMNRSGDEVKKIIQNSKFRIQNLIVAHDDLDIPLGKFKIQQGTGPLLHNGISSIEDKLGTKDFWRIRIGVNNRPLENRMNGETYVLQDFAPDEKETVNKTFPEIFNRLKVEKMI